MSFESAAACEQAFYRAFQDADVTSMMAVWAPIGEVLCVHPMGHALVTREQIRASWLEIFAAPVEQRINFELVSEKRGETLCIRTVVENFSIPGSGEQFAPILATNIYWRGDGGWYLITHHASPARNQPAPAEPDPEQTRH